MSAPHHIDSSGVLHPASDGLLVFIDETGHEEFKGIDYYGFGGCAILASDLECAINVPWRAVRKLVNGDVDKPLHASKFTHKNPTKEQIGAVADFFEQPTFMRFAAVLSNVTELPAELRPIDAALKMLGQRIQMLVDRVPLTQVAVIFEHSQRANSLTEKYFTGFVFMKDGREILTEPLWMKKAENEPGLEVSDFVMHAVSGKMRSPIANLQEFPLDFQSVFMKVPSRLISFMRIDKVSGNSPDEIVEGYELR
jgi:hypothetical protein